MPKQDEYTPQHLVPYGLFATRKWLKTKGVERHTLDNWVKSKQLVSVAQGVYIRPDTKLTWEGVVCSLQRIGYDLSAGGLTALNLLNLSHYLELGNTTTIHLYGHKSLPSWINKLVDNVKFARHKILFKQPIALRQAPSLEQLTISSAEQAWFEVLLDIPDKLSFEHADKLMQGLVNLSPKRLNMLLEECNNVKVRRLFLWFAERHQHAWFKKVDTERFTMDSGLLGSGKRMLAKNGKLDIKYLITVPEGMHE